MTKSLADCREWLDSPDKLPDCEEGRVDALIAESCAWSMLICTSKLCSVNNCCCCGCCRCCSAAAAAAVAPVTKAGGSEAEVEGEALKLVALLGVLPIEALLCTSPRLPMLVFELDASTRPEGPLLLLVVLESAREAFNCRFSSSSRLHRSAVMEKAEQ